MPRRTRRSRLTDDPTGATSGQREPFDEGINDRTGKFARRTNAAVAADMGAPEGARGDTSGDTEDDIGEARMSDEEVVRAIREFRREADDAKRDRMRKNSINQLAYMDEQDFSHKQKGQSAEFLPKVSTSAEQFSAFVKRALVQFGKWFDIELNENVPPFLTDGQIYNLLSLYLHNIPAGTGKVTKFETLVADASKAALLDSLIILKIHGKRVKEPSFQVEPGAQIIDFQTGQVQQMDDQLVRGSRTSWRLCIDMVRAEDYYPDPTGRGLYEIHEVERDYYQVLERAEEGIYDLDAVKQIDQDFQRAEEDKRREVTRGQNESQKPGRRKTIVIREFWGTLLDRDGRMVHENCLAAVANDKYLIRRPEPNPYWHGTSPFVVCPLIRVPHSVWHKALYDSASHLNIALNEMFNLMLDGGMAAVWGIKQLRTGMLQDSRQIQNGIPQGITLAVTDDLPVNAKVLETVSEGQIPTDAMAIFEMVAREFTQAALTNDIKLGSLPPRQVKATEITEASQSQAVTLDSISADIENDLMEPALYKSWMNILQHVEDFDRREIIQTIGTQAAHWLLNSSRAQRFAQFGSIATFKVNGLSSTLSRVRDFQKTAGLAQVVASNPVMMQAFMTGYSPAKLLKMMIKQLNINPDDLARTPNQMSELPQEMQQVVMFAKMMGILPTQEGEGAAGGQPGGLTGATAPGLGMGAQGGMSPSPMGGAQDMTAQVNQEANPTTGIGI